MGFDYSLLQPCLLLKMFPLNDADQITLYGCDDLSIESSKSRTSSDGVEEFLKPLKIPAQEMVITSTLNFAMYTL